MKHSTKLADLLRSTFGLHHAHVTCLAALVIASLGDGAHLRVDGTIASSRLFCVHLVFGAL